MHQWLTNSTQGPAKAILATLIVAAFGVSITAPAHAYPFHSTLSRGDDGPAVRALQIRVAGWYAHGTHRRLRPSSHYGGRTAAGVRRFQRMHGLAVDGVAGPQTFAALNRLQGSHGSTKHFSWAEFAQHRSRSCSRRANRYARTFKGGEVGHRQVRRNVKRVMWRLEALRAKEGGHPIVIDSGFRSVPYNRCIGGASRSQHLYGTAADIQVPEISAHALRKAARRAGFSGIACYRALPHTHLDLRRENAALSKQRSWWWPQRDHKRRDLTTDGKPCRGETPHV